MKNEILCCLSQFIDGFLVGELHVWFRRGGHCHMLLACSYSLLHRELHAAPEDFTEYVKSGGAGGGGALKLSQ